MRQPFAKRLAFGVKLPNNKNDKNAYAPEAKLKDYLLSDDDRPRFVTGYPAQGKAKK